MKRWIVIAWVLALAVAGIGIAGKENLLAHGQVLYLELAPVDPRSLMQGDYMALNFAIGAAIVQAQAEHDAAIVQAQLEHDAPLLRRRDQLAVVRLDERRVAHLLRLHTSETLAEGEHLLRFQLTPARWGNMQAQISTDAYFFQEGQAARFENARYGEFRVDTSGQALLVGLRDGAMKPL